MPKLTMYAAKRLLAMPRRFATRELQAKLRIPTTTYSLWCGRNDFRRAKVAVQGDNSRWIWNRDRLYYWMIAIGYMRASLPNRDRLPTPEQAFKKLGL